MRRHNLSLALRTIWDAGRISRTELAAMLNLSKPAIGRIVNDLLEAGYVSDAPDRPASSRGRPSSYLRLRTETHYFVGVDFRVDRLAIQARDLTGAVLADRHYPAARTEGAETFCAKLAAEMRLLAGQLGAMPSGIGVSLPARVDDTGSIMLDSIYLGWRNVPFCDLLRLAVGPDCPPILMSDVAGCAAIANWREIAADGARDLAHVQVGIGAGVGLAGRAFPTGPAHRLFHRFGHLPLLPGGPLCKCGARGCLDALAGFDALVRYAAPLRLRVGTGPEAIRDFCKALLARHLDHEAAATEAIETAAFWFGRATATVINVVNPSCVTVAGYPLALGEAFMEPFLAALEPFAPGGDSLITQTVLGDEASVVGAVLLGMHAAIADPLGSRRTRLEDLTAQEVGASAPSSAHQHDMLIE